MKGNKMLIFGTVTAVASFITGIISIRNSVATGNKVRRISGVLDLVTTAAYLGIMLLERIKRKA